ncbi:DNA-binding protein [Pseudoduganella sp. FT26W]|uniref:DNA-binding protein n=1 Tax=Duganella aquatilis TaxID=2666082 RepID=A0A844DAJ4_9BURK|nr:DNA-binding protein [Duganella aquatilis]MRW88071.1 DNA-binding protein [Duganella aquatilis]
MAKHLLLSDVDDIVMRALEKRAKEHRWSVEEEAKDMLAELLKRPERRPFGEVLASMPYVGEDDDFSARRT